MSTDAKPRHWANVAETGAVTGMWLMYFVNRVFGRWPFRVVLWPVVAYYVLTQRLARRSSREYLERLEATHHVFGRAPSWRDTFRHVASFAETLLDKGLAVAGKYPFELLTFEGREVMLDSLAQRRGGVLITAHMGCLEVCRLAASKYRQELTLNVLVHTRHAERFNSVLRRLNPDTAVSLLQVTDFSPATAAMLSERVDRGEFIVIAGDRVPVGDSERIAKANFLGASAAFPIGPWVLAAALKCQVVLFTVLHRGAGYHVQFERLFERVELPRASRAAALASAAQTYAAKLEQRCVTAPYDWFNFFSFWDAHG